MTEGQPRPPDRAERTGIITVFVLLVGFHFWGATVAWRSGNLPGGEFRQAQTALSAYFIQLEDNFSPAYPTPVLGPPWSVPMEFPLYQWTAAKLSTATGMDLTQAGRAVSLACFYLTLPAVFLLLGHLRLTPVRRLVPLGLILTCPLYVYYARAFLIETMALMFSVWFLLGFVRAVEKGGRWWLVVANLAGIGAALVKVTTFMLYLLPAGAWGLWILYHSRSTAAAPGWKKFLLFTGWIAAATAVPFAVTLGWLHFADATKALNPNARFLVSSNLTGFNFGFAGARFSGEIWHSLWTVLRLNLAWPPVLAGCVLSLAVFGRRWWGQFAICAALYLGVQLLFPQLYAWHDYYSVASAVLLMAAMGFGLVALLESRLSRAVVLASLVVVFAGQVWLYATQLYQSQRQVSPGGNGLTEALGYLTRPDEVIVIAGEDWNSITPYYARRRALMIRNGLEQDPAYLKEAYAGLKGESVGALIVVEQYAGFPSLVEQAAAELGIDPRPVFAWRQARVYLPAATRERTLANLRRTRFHEGQWMPGAEPRVDRLQGEWFELANLRPEQRENFRLMTPRPVRFFSSFGPGMGLRLGREWFNGHPVTRLRFALPAGAHHLSAELLMDIGTYDPAIAAQDRTDGVNFDVVVVRPDGTEERVLFTRLLDPSNQPEDRGPQVITVDFTLAAPAEVELLLGPGPNGSDSRDWILLGPVKFSAGR